MVKVYFIACLEHITSSIPPYYFDTSAEVDIEGDVDDLWKALIAEYSGKGIQNAIIYKRPQEASTYKSAENSSSGSQKCNNLGVRYEELIITWSQ